MPTLDMVVLWRYVMGINGLMLMPAGVHKSVRVALAIPQKLHDQLSAWAHYEGRPVANLCAVLVEQGLREAQREGIAPNHFSEMEGLKPGEVDEEGLTAPRIRARVISKMEKRQKDEDKPSFTQMVENKIAEHNLNEQVTKDKEEAGTSNEKVAEALAALSRVLLGQ